MIQGASRQDRSRALKGWLAPVYGLVLGAETGGLAFFSLAADGIAFSERDTVIALLFAAVMAASAMGSWMAVAWLWPRRGLIRFVAVPLFTLPVFLAASTGVFYLAMRLGQPDVFEPVYTRYGLGQRMWSLIANSYFFAVFGLRLVWPGVVVLVGLTGLVLGAFQAIRSDR
ncbi:MAG TPA: hypothetical protein ENK41_02085 [Rhodobacteraceae bacterium]|nr:hypothetical protein [Paracoccaceae bacterium]